MANLTKAQLANRVLERLGVKPASQAALAVDALLVQEKVDAAHAELEKEGLAPFATSAIPEWAQEGLEEYVAASVSEYFGRPTNKPLAQRAARSRLATQIAGFNHNVPTQPDSF